MAQSVNVRISRGRCSNPIIDQSLKVGGESSNTKRQATGDESYGSLERLKKCMSRVTVAVKRWRTLTSLWPRVPHLHKPSVFGPLRSPIPSTGRNLQPFAGNGDVSISGEISIKSRQSKNHWEYFLHNLVSRSRNRPKSIVYRIIIANYTLCIFITEKCNLLICVSYRIFYSSRNVIVTNEELRHLGLCSASVLVFHSIDPDPVNLQ